MNYQSSIKLLILLSVILLPGCSDFFSTAEKETPPAPLVNFKPQAEVTELWNTSSGNGTALELKLSPTRFNNQIVVTNYDGTISDINATTGDENWSIQYSENITTGPAVNDNAIFFGTEKGKLVAVNTSNQKILWETNLASESFSKPSVSKHSVIVKTISGQLESFDIKTGKIKWQHHEEIPSVTLRTSSNPITSDGKIIVGFQNGKLASIKLDNGNVIWERTIAKPQGSFTIQRIVDISANPVIQNNRVYIATYQGKVAALNLTNGNQLWDRNISAYSGVSADKSQLFVSDSKSHIWAFNINNGSVNWKQTHLNARKITGPAIQGNYLVVGDAEGYLHWIDKKTGAFVARVHVSDSPIMNTPIVINNKAIVLSNDGELTAYQLS